ncbi:MAG: four helix bundle protein [Waddliaceae bacterium]|nr:four helix bundle protein [Waddliaceae bacterium]
MKGILLAHGGYRNLKSFQVSQLIYDLTVRFCKRFISRFSRTVDQMVQAARSGVQNIAEGSQASATSSKTEIKLTNVARASLEELLLDYEDFLRQKQLPLWERQDPRRQNLVRSRFETADQVIRWIGQEQKKTSQPLDEIAANAIRTLIFVACALLKRQLKSLEARFLNEGGFTERLYHARKSYRKKLA